MITLYKQLNEIGFKGKFYFAYVLALIIGGISISFLLYLGGYLQIFIIVVLLGILVQPYVYLRMRLPLYKELVSIKKEKNPCPHELKDYMYFSKWVWKSTHLRVRKFSKLMCLMYINPILYIPFDCYLRYVDRYDTYKYLCLVYIILASIFTIIIYGIAIYYFDWVCEVCESGEDFDD